MRQATGLEDGRKETMRQHINAGFQEITGCSREVRLNRSRAMGAGDSREREQRIAGGAEKMAFVTSGRSQ